MHDLKFANEIIASIKNDLARKGKSASNNITVNIRLSPLTHVTPEGLTETFKQLASAGGFGDAKLDIKPLEFEVFCRDCKAVSKAIKPIFNCPKCKSADFDIIKEKEFVIDSIKV